MNQKSQIKNRLLACVHIAKKQLGLDDFAYRSLLKRITKKDSAGKLSIDELIRLKKHFKTLGVSFEPQGNSHQLIAKPDPFNEGLKPYFDKIEALLKTLGETRSYADAMASKIVGEKSLLSCQKEGLRKVLIALEYQKKREEKRRKEKQCSKPSSKKPSRDKRQKMNQFEFFLSPMIPSEIQDDEFLSLPFSIQRMIKAVGLEKTALILEHLGGMDVWLSETNETLQALLTPKELEAFLSALGNHYAIRMPKNSKLKIILRNRKIKADRKQGMSYNELALRYDLSVASIWNVLKKH